MTRPVVLVETPYSGGGLEAMRYLACALLDSILRGEAPIASHAIYPLCLPERAEAYAGKTGREIGLECRDSLADLYVARFGWDTERWYYARIGVARYVDTGITDGMNRTGDYLPDRTLTGEALRIWQSGEWPSSARWVSTNETAEGAAE